MSFKVAERMPPFDLSKSRSKILYDEVANDQRRRAHLPVSKRYQGYERGVLEKIVGVCKRIFYIIKNRSINQGLDAYDVHLRGQLRVLRFANHSTQHAPDFDITMISPFETKKRPQKEGALEFRNRWHHNGRRCLSEEDEPQCQGCYQTVTSSHDLIRDKIAMMRQVETKAGSSVFYTGRCDSFNKDLEQSEFIFRTEGAKDVKERKWIDLNGSNEYTLPYVVNNLMSTFALGGIGVTVWNGFNERQATIEEQEVLSKLGKRVIDGKAVHLRPIYFNQTFNALTALGVSSLQKTINEKGERSLKALANEWVEKGRVSGNDLTLLSSAIKFLEKGETLLPEEAFFYRDLICKILGIAQVIHCKSSTDRTMIAGAISMATTVWRNLNLDISQEQPHLILSNNLYKELFASSLFSGRPITQYARFSPGIIRGVQPCSNKIGFTWELTGGENPILLRMLPQAFKTARKRAWCIKWIVSSLHYIGRFFYPTNVVEQWKSSSEELLNLDYFRKQAKKRLFNRLLPFKKKDLMDGKSF